MGDSRNDAARADLSNINDLVLPRGQGPTVARPSPAARASSSSSVPQSQIRGMTDAARADLSRISDLTSPSSEDRATASRSTFASRASAASSSSSTRPTGFRSVVIDLQDGSPRAGLEPRATLQSRNRPVSPLRSGGTTESRSRQRTRARAADVVEISSDDSSNDEGGYVEVTEVRRAPRPTYRPEDLMSPPPVLGSPAEPIRASSVRSFGHRPIGISVDSSTGDVVGVSRPRPSSSSLIDANGEPGFAVVSANSRALERSANPITDQRFKSTTLARPTMSPPRAKPPPIERPLLSTFTCPICFEPPANACLTPCGHLLCGECLFQTLKTQAVQRGAMEDENAAFSLGGMFAAFAPAGTFGNQDVGAGARRGGATAGFSGGRGGRGGGGRARNKPDPLAGHCPVCRAKIKGGFSGRDKGGVLGLRLLVGKPVNDPREESKASTSKADEPGKPDASAPPTLVDSVDNLVKSMDDQGDTITAPSTPQGRKRRRRSSATSQDEPRKSESAM